VGEEGNAPKKGYSGGVTGHTADEKSRHKQSKNEMDGKNRTKLVESGQGVAILQDREKKMVRPKWVAIKHCQRRSEEARRQVS